MCKDNANEAARLGKIFAFWIAITFAILAGNSNGTITIYSDETTQSCVPFQEAFICSDAPYNETSFPNAFGHQNMADAQSALNDFIPLIDNNCSKYLKQFLCFVFAPPCTFLNSPIPVCRSLCTEAVTTECRKILNEYNQRPEVLECKNYPKSGLCIGQNNTISDHVGTEIRGTTAKPLYPNYDSFFTDDTSMESRESDIVLDLHLLVTNGKKIQLLQIRSPNSLDSITVFRSLTEVTAVDYYQPNQYFYWSRKLERKIFRGKLVLESLQDIRPIVSVESNVESIAVDWNLCILFWLESYPRARLRTSSLSGRQVTTLVSIDMYTPISLTQDPIEGLLFWINKRGPIFNQFSTIESYSVVTERRTPIFNISGDTIDDGGRPQALVADIQEKRLYWVDAMSKSLHVIGYDGSEHKMLLRDHKRLSDPESLTVRGEHVLWTDRTSSSIVWVNKITGKDELIVKTFDSTPPQNIKIYSPRSQLLANDTTYDKASLAKKWRDLSSTENMAVYDYDDDDDDDDDDYYYNNNDGSDKTKKRKKNSSATVTINVTLYMCVALVKMLDFGL